MFLQMSTTSFQFGCLLPFTICGNNFNKMGYCVILLALVAVVTASPVMRNDLPAVGVRNNALETLFLNLLEDVRSLMITGSEDIPVLDPLRIDHLDVDIGQLLGVDDSYVNLRNFEARQLSTFVIDDLSIVLFNILLQRYRFQVEGRIPVIELEADNYALNVNVMGFHLFGAGEAKIRIYDPRLVVNIEAGVTIIGGLGLVLRSAHVEVTLGSIEPQLSGMFHNPGTDEFVNLFIKYLIEDIMTTYQPEITELLSTLVLEVGNAILADLDLGSILGREGMEIIEASLPKPMPGLRQ